MFEDFEDEVAEEEFAEEEGLGEGADNRTFLIVAGVLGGLILLSLVCFGAYLAFIAPQNRAERATQEAATFRQQTEVALAAQQTAEMAKLISTATRTPLPTNTPPATATPVVAEPSPTRTSVAATQDPRTATVAALLTQAAAGATVAPTITGLPTSLPQTGLADDIGLPGLMALAALAVVLIFLVRRLRASTG